jgi:hypothetical protein
MLVTQNRLWVKSFCIFTRSENFIFLQIKALCRRWDDTVIGKTFVDIGKYNQDWLPRAIVLILECCKFTIFELQTIQLCI